MVAWMQPLPVSWGGLVLLAYRWRREEGREHAPFEEEIKVLAHGPHFGHYLLGMKIHKNFKPLQLLVH